MKNTKTEKKVTILISVILTILLILGLTYAYFSAKSTTDTRSVVTGNLKITYEDGRMINAEKLIPMPEEYVDEEGTEISFTVKNSGSMSGYFNVGLIDVNIDEGLASEDFKWRLKSEDKVIINGTFKNIITDKVLQSGLEIGANETKNYKLQIWIQETDKDQTSMMNKVFRAKIDITGKNKLTDLAQNEPLVLTNTVEGDSLKNLKIYGNSFQSNLPYPYQSVEYIESTGTQYIALNYVPKNVGVIEYTLNMMSLEGNRNGFSNMLLGTDTGAFISTSVASTRVFLPYQNKYIYRLELANNNIVVDGTNYAFDFSYLSANTTQFWLFRRSDEAFMYGNQRAYGFKVYDANNDLIYDLMPCHNVQTNEIGMYDKINNVFYTNAGTGTFLKGNDVVPTPENPVDVVSVGENSKNLLDETLIKASFLSKEDGKFSGTTSIIQQSYFDGVSITKRTSGFGNLPLLKSGNYTFSGNSLYKTRIYTYNRGGTLTSSPSQGLGYINNNVKYLNFTLTEDSYIDFSQYDANSNIEFSNLQIEEGTTGYRPYNYVDITSSGKNLFDIDSFISLSGNSRYYRKEDNKLIQIAPDYRSDTDLPIVMTLQPGTYHISGLLTGAKLKLINATIDRVITYYNGSFTITEPTEITFKSWYVANTEIGTIQLEYGESETDYEPYQEPITTTIDLTGHEPLRKIGDVADYIDYNKGKIVRNIGKIVFDGTEDFTYATTNPNGLARFRYYMPAEYNVSNSTNLLGLSSHFGYEVQGNASAVNKNKFFIQANAINLLFYGYLDINEYPTVEDFKEMVETKYNEGNPIKMYYQLATPKEEDINLPDIKTLNGTTIISSNGNIKPFFEGKY